MMRGILLVPAIAGALVLALLPGCVGSRAHVKEDDGHKGIVVDAVTGKPLGKARLFGSDPTFRSRVIKARADGTFCFHFKEGVPSSITITSPGYEPLIVPTNRFVRTSRFELKIDTRPRSKIWRGEKEDILTPFERDIMRSRGITNQ
jgi:hypothetical protein